MTSSEIQLRLLCQADRDFYRSLYTCPVAMAQIAAPLTVEAADAALARVCRHNTHVPARHTTWLIAFGGCPVGLGSLERRNGEIGLMLAPDHWQRRLGSAAIDRLLRQGFGEGLDLIIAECRAEHVPVVQRLLEPFGFRRRAARREKYVDWHVDRQAWSPQPRRVAPQAPKG